MHKFRVTAGSGGGDGCSGWWWRAAALKITVAAGEKTSFAPHKEEGFVFPIPRLTFLPFNPSKK